MLRRLEESYSSCDQNKLFQRVRGASYTDATYRACRQHAFSARICNDTQWTWSLPPLALPVTRAFCLSLWLSMEASLCQSFVRGFRVAGRALAIAKHPRADPLSRLNQDADTVARVLKSVSLAQLPKAGKSPQRLAYRCSSLIKSSGSDGLSHRRPQNSHVPAVLLVQPVQIAGGAISRFFSRHK